MVAPHPLSWADAPPYHYHGTTQPAKGEEDDAGAGQDGGARTLWIGGLLHWMDEDYLYACFTYSPELLTLFVKRSKQTGQSEGYGFLKFANHTAAAHILKSYNAQKMPNVDRDFSLNWAAHSPAPDKLPDQDSKLNLATQQDGHADDPAAASEYAIFVGDLAYDVTEYMLHHLFKTRYPSVKSAKVIFDKLTGRSKGYGFVRFGDANEHAQAMTEMNGAYCSTRPMRIGPAPSKKNYDNSTQGTDSYDDPNNSRLFVGRLDQSITDDDLLQAFSPFGELVNVKVLASKACGFVTYSNRASAEEAMRMLNGSQLGGNNIRLPWCRCSGNKQYEQDQQNGGQHGRPKSFNPSGFGWSPQDPYAYAQTGHPGYGYYQQQLPTVQLSIKQPNQSTYEVVAEKGCDIVTHSPWPSAEETMRMLNGSQLGGNSLRLSWGCHSANKQQDSQKHGWYCFDLSPEVGDSRHKMMNYTSCSTLKIGGLMDGVVASMGMSFLRRGFSGTGGGGNGGGEKEFWHWVEQTYSKPFLEKLDGGLTGMGYDRPTGRMSRIFICALAYSVLCQASKDWYDLYLLLVYGASRHSPDTWDELATAVRPFAQRFLQHTGEESSRDVWGCWEYYERAPSTICWV